MDSLSEAQGKTTRQEIRQDSLTSSMESLPREVVLDIISRIPTVSLLDVKLACRPWCKLAQDPILVDMHFTRMAQNDPCLILHSDYPVPNQLYALYFYAHNEKVGMVKKFCAPAMPAFDVVGSCNGRLCLSDASYNNTLHIYNPFTSDCVELPKYAQYSDRGTVFGFGFHPRTKEHKVIKIVPVLRNTRGTIPRHGNSWSEVEILTVGSQTWRSLGKATCCPIRSQSMILINGRLHWVAWIPRYHPPGGRLISFDLAEEQFQEIRKPVHAGREWRSFDLVVLVECLSAAVYSNNGQIDIWIMKNYGVEKSWIKEFSIGSHLPRGLEQDVDSSFRLSKKFYYRSRTRVLCSLKNGKTLLQYRCKALVSYDPKLSTFREITLPEMPNWFETVVHVGSLNWIDTFIGI